MKEYKVIIEEGCRIFKSRDLLIKAMESLPADVVITHIRFGTNFLYYYMMIESNLLPYVDKAELNLNLVNSVKFELLPKR